MLREFYEAVLPQNGHFCLFKLPERTHIWADSTDQLTEITNDRLEQQGVYFATSSFQTTDNRTQPNVLALRALRLDIDAGDEKYGRDPAGTYPTRNAALAAIKSFIQASGIRPSYIVSSGEGWHLYYCLLEDIDPDTWMPLATGLDILCKKLGLKTDLTVTKDTSRILRPIGTLHKNGNRVQLVADTGARYSASDFASKVPAKAMPKVAKYSMDINDDLKAETAPKSVHKILEHCGAMQEVNASKGDVPEPFWRAMLGVVKYTVEGLEAAQELSSGHPEYDEDNTERKFNAWATGPSTCAEFSKHSKACAGCTHKGKIKSPISLGYLTERQIEALPPELQPVEPEAPAPTGDPWDGCIPPRFQVLKGLPNTLMCILKTEKEDETGETVPVNVQVPVTHDIFWLGYWTEAEGSDDSAQVTMHLLSGGRVKNYTFDQGLAASRSDLLRYMASKAIHTTSHPKAGQAMENYVKGQLLRIKDPGRRPQVADRMGMRIEDNGELTCAHGKYYIRGDGTIQESMLRKGARSVADKFVMPLPENYSGVWPASVWDTHVNPAAAKYVDFVRRYYNDAGLEKFQLAIMLGLASPFMAFITGSYVRGSTLPPNGFSVSLYSREPGRGKTALVKVVMMAYGSREGLVKDSNGMGSTDLARSGKLSLWGTMPMSMDEMGTTKEKAISDMVSMVGNGAARERLDKNGVLISSAPWALMNMITTNRSQRDMIAAVGTDSPAIQSRLLELDVDSVSKFDNKAGGKLDNYNNDASSTDVDCAGAFGAVIEYWMCRQGAPNVNKVVTAYVNKARQILGELDSNDRYQFRALGAVLTLQAVLTKLGLVMFDTATLVRTFKESFDAGIAFIKDTHTPTSGPELLAKMLSDISSGIIVTESETHTAYSRGKFDTALNLRMPDKPVARYINSTGRTYVNTTVYRDWCAENKVSERSITGECREKGVLIPYKRFKPTDKDAYTDYYNLRKGMRDSSEARCRCMVVDTRELMRVIKGDWDNILPEHDCVVVPIKRGSGEQPAATAEVGTAP